MIEGPSLGGDLPKAVVCLDGSAMLDPATRRRRLHPLDATGSGRRSSPAAAHLECRPDGLDGELVAVPPWVLAASRRLPFDVYVLGPREPILYAARGSPSQPVMDRLSQGVVLWAAPLHPARLSAIVVGVIAEVAKDQASPVSERARLIRSALRGLFRIADGEKRSADHLHAIGAGCAGAAAVLLDPILEDRDLIAALLAGSPGRDGPESPLVERSIDGALYTVRIGTRLGLLGDSRGARLLLAAMLLRDLPLFGASTSSSASVGHPLAAAAICRACLGPREAIVEVVARHHERFDGSGYPCGLRGEELTDLDLVAAAGDAVAAALPPSGLAVTRPTDALVTIRFVLRRRFPLSLASAVEEAVAELLPPAAGDWRSPPSPSPRAPARAFRLPARDDVSPLGGQRLA